MLRFLLNHYSVWAIMVMTAVLFLGLTVMMYFIIRRFGKSFLVTKDASYISGTITICNELGSVILAFVIVLMWQDFATLQQGVLHEVKSISKLMVFADLLPNKDTEVLQKGLIIYTDSIIHDEWPKMEQGHESELSAAALANLEKIIFHLNQTNSFSELYQAEMVNDLNEIISTRNDRLGHLDSTLPNFVRVIIFLILMGILFFLCLLEAKQKTREMLFIMALSVLLGLTFSLILIMDYPFSGEFSISSYPFQEEILHQPTWTLNKGV